MVDQTGKFIKPIKAIGALALAGIVGTGIYVKTQGFSIRELPTKPTVSTAPPVQQTAATPPATAPPAKVEIISSKEEALTQKVAELETKLAETQKTQLEKSIKLAEIEKNLQGFGKDVSELQDDQGALAEEFDERIAQIIKEHKAAYEKLHSEISSVDRAIAALNTTLAGVDGELKLARREREEREAREIPDVAKANVDNAVDSPRPAPNATAPGDVPLTRPRSLSPGVERANAVIAPNAPRVAFERWSSQFFQDSSGNYVKAFSTFSAWGAVGKTVIVRAAIRDSNNKEWDVTPGLSLFPTKDGQFYREFIVFIPSVEIPKDSKVALKFYSANDLINPIAISDWKASRELLSKDIQPFRSNSSWNSR